MAPSPASADPAIDGAAAAFAFPSGRERPPGTDGELAARGLALRPARAADAAFLRRLYGALRADELAPLAWPDQAKAAFLDSQFSLQHRHFTAVFAAADFLVVEHCGAPVGRLYVDWGPTEALVIDIGLLPSHRGAGLGSALLGWVAGQARRAKARRVTLHVLSHNAAARRLYERLGFRSEGVEGAHLFMAQPLS